jgi:hypothetical protein
MLKTIGQDPGYNLGHLGILAAIKARDPDCAQKSEVPPLGQRFGGAHVFTRLESLRPAELLEVPRRYVESS